MHQLQIDYQPGLVERYPDFMDCVKASVYGCPRALKAVAADLDMTATKLSRTLAQNPNDQVGFWLCKLPALIEATGDKTPVYWLAEKFLEDAGAKKQRALDALPGLVDQIKSVLAHVGLKAVA